jgi:hypothetical protein
MSIQGNKRAASGITIFSSGWLLALFFCLIKPSLLPNLLIDLLRMIPSGPFSERMTHNAIIKDHVLIFYAISIIWLIVMISSSILVIRGTRILYRISRDQRILLLRLMPPSALIVMFFGLPGQVVTRGSILVMLVFAGIGYLPLLVRHAEEEKLSQILRRYFALAAGKFRGLDKQTRRGIYFFVVGWFGAPFFLVFLLFLLGILFGVFLSRIGPEPEAGLFYLYGGAWIIGMLISSRFIRHGVKLLPLENHPRLRYLKLCQPSIVLLLIVVKEFPGLFGQFIRIFFITKRLNFEWHGYRDSGFVDLLLVLILASVGYWPISWAALMRRKI